jgi:hypothetical protein
MLLNQEGDHSHNVLMMDVEFRIDLGSSPASRGPAGDYILEIQSKRYITFSPGDSEYQTSLARARSVVVSVPADRHILGIATLRTSRKISGVYQDVLKWALTMESAAAFFTRIDNPSGGASVRPHD